MEGDDVHFPADVNPNDVNEQEAPSVDNPESVNEADTELEVMCIRLIRYIKRMVSLFIFIYIIIALRWGKLQYTVGLSCCIFVRVSKTIVLLRA